MSPDKTHVFHIWRKLEQVSATIRTRAGDDDEEVKAGNIVPTPTDPHAARERVVVRKRQKFVYGVDQFRQEGADGPRQLGAGRVSAVAARRIQFGLRTQ